MCYLSIFDSIIIDGFMKQKTTLGRFVGIENMDHRDIKDSLIL